MADNTKIEWTDATWNPITGCSVVSPGCTNCYAMRLAGTRMQHHPSRAGLTRETKAGPVWTGEVRMNEEWLAHPLRWKRPRRIFVCAHGDLFHESVPDEWIDRVFARMALAQRHTMQVLTKRADRARAYITTPGRSDIIRDVFERELVGDMTIANYPDDWPLPNIWLGVSVEDQRHADDRILHLLETPARVRFLSCEPLLGPIDLTRLDYGGWNLDALRGQCDAHTVPFAGIDWVIAGSESGPGARPCDLAWVRSLRDQCISADVSFFWKQHIVNGRKISAPTMDGRSWTDFPKITG